MDYEYKTVRAWSPFDFETDLNNHGRQRWRVVGFHHDNNKGYTALLERKV